MEFKDKNSAGQVTQNPNDFTFPSYGSFILYVMNGYAVLDDASFPIVGEGEQEPNDTFIQQLVANGKAAIDAVDKLGIIDRAKVAVGGHSYGAFMTANLLTHCALILPAELPGAVHTTGRSPRSVSSGKPELLGCTGGLRRNVPISECRKDEESPSCWSMGRPITTPGPLPCRRNAIFRP
ncbi:MAG: hypothetical protein MZV63_58310 [Marinilabiliales bacterium]|nr:hypothetical protein [Marinilabiliales bacterium]